MSELRNLTLLDADFVQFLLYRLNGLCRVPTGLAVLSRVLAVELDDLVQKLVDLQDAVVELWDYRKILQENSDPLLWVLKCFQQLQVFVQIQRFIQRVFEQGLHLELLLVESRDLLRERICMLLVGFIENLKGSGVSFPVSFWKYFHFLTNNL